MTRQWPDLPDADPALTAGFWESEEGDARDDRTLEEIIQDSREEAGAHYVGDQTMRRYVDLQVVGESVQPGRLDLGIAQEILFAYQLEWSGAADARNIRDIPVLDLVGIGSGSAILHLQPAVALVVEPHQLPVPADPLDGVMDTITAVHVTAEAEGDLRQFADYDDLLRGLHSVVDVLDKYNLELGVIWRSATGSRRRSRITARGRAHVRTMWENETSTFERTVSGRVVGLSLGENDPEGTFSLKAGPMKTSPRYEIHADRGTVRNLQLGDQVHARISEETRTNRLGISMSPRRTFIGYAVGAIEEELPEGE